MYPSLVHRNLAALAHFVGINQVYAHRAQAEVETLYQLLKTIFQTLSPKTVLSKAKSIYQKSSVPSKLRTNIDSFPDSPGIYLFFGSHSTIPLYIGKSISLRQRILSHFQGDYTHAKEFTMTQQVERIEIIPTAGELSALLLESQLIKEKMPLYNRKLGRKTLIAGFKIKQERGYLTVSIIREQVQSEEDLKAQGIIGAFRSIHAAKQILLELIKEFKLCPKLCQIEQGKGACFSYQLKCCLGACIGEEGAEHYNPRILLGLNQFKEEAWPYQGAIAIKEQCPINKLTHYLVFDQWRHLGSIVDEDALSTWKQLLHKLSGSHFDSYKILRSHLKNRRTEENVVCLSD